MAVAEVYQLPSDHAETKRLATQHRLWDLMIGDIYPTALAETMDKVLKAPSQNHVPLVLDVGCGSGIWAIEMAHKFPQSQVFGCDMNEWPEYRNAPANFRFIGGDVSQGLPRDLQPLKFDVIHCRCVAQHVSDPGAFITILADALQPNGVLLLADGDWVAFDENKMPLIPFVFNAGLPEEFQRDSHSDRSFYAGWLHLFGKLTRSRNYKPVDVLLHDTGVLQDIQAHTYFTPINWDGGDVENGEKIGIIMDRNMRDFFRNAYDTALRSGITAKMLDIWEGEYLKEFDERRYNIWHYSWARKVAE